MFIVKSNKSIGAYISKLIKKNAFKSQRKFGKEFLKLRDNREPSESEINNMNNKLSQICNGSNSIQIEDLPIFCKLLGVSCEEILSCGKCVVPVSSHMTNYEVAYSKDKLKWEEYINHPDNLFMNFDEYGKSVIDYALEFRNYKFIKYLMDEGYIRFVDNSGYMDFGITYGAGTNIKRRNSAYIDSKTLYQLQTEDRLRTHTIAIAIENNDFEILDELRAREVPPLDKTNIFASYKVELLKFKNDVLIDAVANADEKILDYFSQEFKVTNSHKRTNTFIFPYVGDVIDVMLKENKNPELLIRRAINHNKKTYDMLINLVNEEFENRCGYYQIERNDEFSDEIMRKVQSDIRFDGSNSMVSFYYTNDKKEYKGIVTNIVRVENKSNKTHINELIDELNEWYDKIANLKGDN